MKRKLQWELEWAAVDTMTKFIFNCNTSKSHRCFRSTFHIRKMRDGCPAYRQWKIDKQLKQLNLRWYVLFGFDYSIYESR